MPTVNINNITINYREAGQGNPIVLLHGLGSTWKDWEAQIPVFAKKYRVIVPDLRAHGKTSVPEKEFGIGYMSADLKSFLDKLNIEKASLIGFSMGGAVTFQFALDYPAMVDKLVIVNSGPDFNKMGQFGEDLLKNRTADLKQKGLKRLAAEIAGNMFPEKHQDHLREEFEKRCAANDEDAYLKSFTTLMEWGIGDALGKIKAKTLVVAAELDYTPVEAKAEYVNRMQNAQLAIIENARHGVVLDQPEAFNEVVLKFLDNG